MGLDIEVFRLKKIDKTNNGKKWTSEDLEKENPGWDLFYLKEDNFSKAPPGFDDFAVDVDCGVISYAKMLETTSTPEHPRKWEDGWQWGGEGSTPWDESVPVVEGCSWYVHLVRYDGENRDENGLRKKLDEVWLPCTEELEDKSKDRADIKAILKEEEGHGYQRKGMEDGMYDYFEQRGCYWVFKKDELEKIKQWAEDPEEFQSNIIDNFEEGKDGVWFWY